MNESTIEAGQPEQQPNSGQKVQNKQVSPSIANAPVVGSLFGIREIKFRFWLGHIGKMTYSHSLSEVGKIIPDFTEDIIPLQYTGLKDKNGKEIYEGDVLNIRFGKSVDSRTGQRYEHNNVTVKWDEDRWVIVGGNMTFEPVSLCAYSLPEYEIIGNVFENPELLEALR